MRRLTETVLSGHDSAPDWIPGAAEVAYPRAESETSVLSDCVHRRNRADRFQVTQNLFSLRHGS